jgi:hypothetical protein
MAASSANADVVELRSVVRGDGADPAADGEGDEYGHAAAAVADAQAAAEAERREEEARRAAEAHEARVVMAEAQLNRIWKKQGLKIERIVPKAAADAPAGNAAGGGGKLTRQLKTLASIFSDEPHLVPGGEGAAAAAAPKRAGRGGGGREARGIDAHKYGTVQCADVREDVYPVAPAQLQRARELENPERRLGVFRASAHAFKQHKQQRKSPLSRAPGPAAPEPGPALRHVPEPGALVR